VNRRNVILGLAALVLVGLGVGLVLRAFSGPPANRILVNGDVRAVVRTIPAPALSYPTVSYTVQVPSNPAQGDTVAVLNETVISGPQPSNAASRTGVPVISGNLVAVNAQVGDHVTTGAVLAQIDAKTLDLGVDAAKLAAVKTKTTVSVLNNGIDTILDNIDKLATGRAALATGKAQLAAGKVQLAKAKATLLKAKAGLLAGQKKLLEAKKNRAQLEAALAALKQQASQFPPGQVPAALRAKIAQLQGLLASINPGLAKIAAGLKQVNAGLAKVVTGEAALKTGAAALATAASQLATAADALHTAKTQTIKARDYVRIIASGANVGVVLAQAKRDQATIVSPVSGVVTQAASKGTVAIVGAPLFRISPDDAALVDTYVTGEQLNAVHVGSIADITYDSSRGTVLHGSLVTIGSNAVYPPTSFPTSIVHMTRTVKITFRLDSGDRPPAGTPVDIAIHTD